MEEEMPQTENIDAIRHDTNTATYNRHFLTFWLKVAHSTRATDNCQDFQAIEHDAELTGR